MIAPVWHAFPLAVQAAPVVHASHAPLKQTWFVPHDVPFDRSAVPAVHTAVPVAQLNVAALHDPAIAQAPPAAQLQLPLPSQALSAPLEQVVPAGWCVPESVHAIPPPTEQVVSPLSHVLPTSAHVAFAVNAVHVPALHSEPVPHEVQFATFVVRSVHDEAPNGPPGHASSPLWQLFAGVQLTAPPSAVIAVQVGTAHVPALQNLPPPHDGFPVTSVF
jgi:hypothetical protein